jgi:uncharacterized protein
MYGAAVPLSRFHVKHRRCYCDPSSSADAISGFPTTATSVGVRISDSKFECFAPFGLDDLFGLIVRPNEHQITQAIYQAKIHRWRSVWPRLTYLPWGETA